MVTGFQPCNSLAAIVSSMSGCVWGCQWAGEPPLPQLSHHAARGPANCPETLRLTLQMGTNYWKYCKGCNVSDIEEAPSTPMGLWSRSRYFKVEFLQSAAASSTAPSLLIWQPPTPTVLSLHHHASSALITSTAPAFPIGLPLAKAPELWLEDPLTWTLMVLPWPAGRMHSHPCSLLLLRCSSLMYCRMCGGMFTNDCIAFGGDVIGY